MTHVLRPGSTSGYISSSLRGSQCPWSIRALPGQRLNITLFDFSIFKPASPGEPIGSRGTSLVPSHSNNMQSLCKRYATIQEHSQRRETPICGGLNRVRSVFLSDGHKINVRVINRSRAVVAGDVESRFFLRYEAIGCPRVTAPTNSRVTYNDKTMTVTCNTTGETWYLTCMDNEWVGTIANCTARKYRKFINCTYSTMHTNMFTLFYHLIMSSRKQEHICVPVVIINLNDFQHMLLIVN